MLKQLFNVIDFPLEDSAVLERKSNQGRSIYTLCTGLKLNTHHKGQIVLSPWGKLFYISSYTPIHSIDSQPTQGISYNKQRQFYQTYGQYDWIQLSPVCGLIWFLKSSQWEVKTSNSIYSQVGILYDSNVYYSDGLEKAYIKPLDECIDLFITKHVRFLHTPLIEQKLKSQIHQGPNQIEFILRVTDYVQREGPYYQGQISGDRKICSLEELYEFFRKRGV